MWQTIGEFLRTYFGPEQRTLWYILGSYGTVYVIGFVLPRLIMGMRHEPPPYTDSIVRWTLLLSFLFAMALPVYYMIDIVCTGPFRMNWQRLVFYALFVCLNLLALSSLFRRRPRLD